MAIVQRKQTTVKLSYIEKQLQFLSDLNHNSNGKNWQHSKSWNYIEGSDGSIGHQRLAPLYGPGSILAIKG